MYRQPRSGFTRIPFVQSCRVRIDGREQTGLVCNVSVLGAFLHLEPLPPVGANVGVELALHDDGPPVVADARVTWIREEAPDCIGGLPPGCGLRFTTLAPADVRRLNDLVTSFRAAPRPLLERAESRSEKVRIPYVAPCVVSGADGPRRASVCNLSRDGVYVCLDQIPALGEAVIVAFRLPGQGEAFERIGVVAWRNPDGPERVHALPPGCGLRFVNLSAADRALLVDLVESYVDALPAPRRELG